MKSRIWSRYPQRWVVVDTEASIDRSEDPQWEFQQTLKYGCCKIVDPANPSGPGPWTDRFRTIAEFQAILDLMPFDRRVIWIFAHSMGYDARTLGLMEWLRQKYHVLDPPESAVDRYRYKKPRYIIDGRPWCVRSWDMRGQRYIWFDSLNWLPWSLARIGEQLGMSKGDLPHQDAPEAIWWAYCERDVELLDRALRRLWGFLQHEHFPVFDLTPAAAIRKHYRKHFERGRIVAPESTEAFATDRPAYFGGRVECFHVGHIDGPIYKVDVAGLYPRVMHDHPLPCEVHSHGSANIDWNAFVDLERTGGTAEVYLDTPDHEYPIRALDGVCWCRGRLHTALAGAELADAVRRGLVRRVARWTLYNLDRLFDRWARYWWRRRLAARRAGDAMVDRLIKQMMSSLHGKFGQKDGEWAMVADHGPTGDYLHGVRVWRDGQPPTEVRILDGKRWHRTMDRDHPQGFLPIASHVAAHARSYMDAMRELAGPDHVLYQATDSFLLTEPGFDRLRAAGVVDDDRLGSFKYEDTYSWIDLQAPNHYEYPDGWVHSGVARGSTCVAPGIYEVERWESFHEANQRGVRDRVHTRRELIRLRLAAGRRRVLDDGRTEPYAIDNWDKSLDDMKKLRWRDLLYGG